MQQTVHLHTTDNVERSISASMGGGFMGNLRLSPDALNVLESRYLRRDENRRIVETPEALLERVAKSVAHAELLFGDAKTATYWEEQFLEMLRSLVFLPNSPTLMNAGTPLGQLSACFVLPVEDTTESIFDAVKHMAMVQRTGGGTGFSFSKLRPRNDVVASTAGVASGPVSFMNIFDCTTEHIKQGGKRRGANMGVMRVDHPDIMEFINAKLEEGRLQNFNISVGITNSFMDTLRKDGTYSLIHPGTGAETGSLRAKEVFQAVAEAAWLSGDPGLIFLDTINGANPTPHLGPIEATNPCGEIPLLPYESCNLGSINLARMLSHENGKEVMDWDQLRITIRKAIRFLDDVIEVNGYPIPEIEAITKGNRKVGLGVMGFSEMLIRLGISYDSDEAVHLADTLMGVVAREADVASQDLAEKRGVYRNWKGSVHHARGVRRRNATCTTIAPTGTLSIIAGTSPSMEPLFALAYRRSHVLDDQTLFDINPLFSRYAERLNLDVQSLTHQVMEKGRLADVRGVPDELKKLFVTALEIPFERHLMIQAACQKHIDNSVSKTINLPREASVHDVKEAYRLAWELGLKGITTYRYGSRSAQVLELGIDEKAFHYDHASSCDPEECRI